MLFKVSNIPTWSRRKRNKPGKMIATQSVGKETKLTKWQSCTPVLVTSVSSGNPTVPAHCRHTDILKFSLSKTTRDILVSGHLYCVLAILRQQANVG